MSTPRHDWDRDEREALAGLEDQIETMRRRHSRTPPFDVLRAAHADALPRDLQDAVSEHLSSNAMSRMLAAGAGDEEPSLSETERERLLSRILKDADTTARAPGAWAWLRPVLLGSGIVAVASLVWIVARQTETGERLGPPETTVVVALPPAVPPFLLPFEKPDVRLGMGALTWRGSSPASADGNQLLADLKPGLDAYRAGDYAGADRALTALANRYPGTVEILFYLGVSRLFLDDLSGAVAALEAADAVGDPMFASEIAWYRAIAEQRSGNLASARLRLEAACRTRGTEAARACAAIERLDKGGANSR